MSDEHTTPHQAASLRARVNTHLRLGRVSNLPTVWSNVLAAAVISGGLLSASSLASLLIACSAMYIGGMYLNDALDADIDALERAERPIPSGMISKSSVLKWCALWFSLGLCFFLIARAWAPEIPDDLGGALFAQGLIAPVALLACIITYNRFHKNNPFGPALMASCRALVYLSVGYTLVLDPPLALWIGAILAFVWIMALTSLAKRESRALAGHTSSLPDWPLALLAIPIVVTLTMMPRITLLAVAVTATLVLVIVLARRWMRSGDGSGFARAIGLLIAGVALVDALAIVRSGGILFALVAVLLAGLTVILQRHISGT